MSQTSNHKISSVMQETNHSEKNESDELKQKQLKSSGQETSNILTTRQGHPVYDNQNLRTVGNRGPATLENYQFLEKMSHFDRERVPERVVHARGAGAHGYFEAYGTVGNEPVLSTQGQNFFRRKVKEHLYLYVSLLLYMADIHLKRFATREGSPLKCIPKMATGTL